MLALPLLLLSGCRTPISSAPGYEYEGTNDYDPTAFAEHKQDDATRWAGEDRPRVPTPTR